MVNSPTVLTPPVPQWGPSVARGRAPRSPRHPQRLCDLLSKLFRIRVSSALQHVYDRGPTEEAGGNGLYILGLLTPCCVARRMSIHPLSEINEIVL